MPMTMTKPNRRSYNHRTGERVPVTTYPHLCIRRPERPPAEWTSDAWRAELLRLAAQVRESDPAWHAELQERADDLQSDYQI
jgi:hypothetical protein